MNTHKFILGTAQLSQQYGINNTNHNFSMDNSFRILKASIENGINRWDTSPEYGISEEIIGKFLKKNKPRVSISTKLPSIKKRLGTNPNSRQLRAYIDGCLKRSLENLNLKEIDIYYIHDEEDLSYFGDDLIEILSQKSNQNIIKQIGISIYDLDILDLNNKYKIIKTIQIPINIFDKKHVDSIHLLVHKNLNFVARSVFLQGLFFMDPKKARYNIPHSFKYLNQLISFSKNNNLSITEIAIGYVKSFSSLCGLLIGVDNVNQLNKNVEIFKKNNLNDSDIKNLNELFSELPKELIDPRKWS